MSATYQADLQAHAAFVGSETPSDENHAFRRTSSWVQDIVPEPTLPRYVLVGHGDTSGPAHVHHPDSPLSDCLSRSPCRPGEFHRVVALEEKEEEWWQA